MVVLFRKFSIITITTVILLIFVGGIVRATGSGMGCPDWPKCFGMWIPPIEVSELPQNYQQIFGEKLKGEVVFNPIKTWIEYINRLLGALTGIFIFIAFVFSFFRYRKSNKAIVNYSFLAFILVGFEGWLGSKVVSSELHPVLISVHMFVAIIILGILIMVVLKSFKLDGIIKTPERSYSALSFVVLLSIFLLIGQILFGTQLREGIDIAQKLLGDVNRKQWTSTIMGKIWFHGGFSILILGLIYWLNSKLKQSHFGFSITRWSGYSLYLTVFSVITGSILGFMGLPAFLQPFHLVLSVLIISCQFIVYFSLETDLI